MFNNSSIALSCSSVVEVCLFKTMLVCAIVMHNVTTSVFIVSKENKKRVQLSKKKVITGLNYIGNITSTHFIHMD